MNAASNEGTIAEMNMHRRRIYCELARWLHDELAQTLVAALGMIAISRRDPACRQSSELERTLQQLEEALQRALQGVREQLARLRPWAVAEATAQGLAARIDAWARLAGIPIVIEQQEDLPPSSCEPLHDAMDAFLHALSNAEGLQALSLRISSEGVACTLFGKHPKKLARHMQDTLEKCVISLPKGVVFRVLVAGYGSIRLKARR